MSTESQVNNKRIAKNTLFLYFRMLLLLAIGLLTSRVNLQALGVDNYGINSVIAGFLSMFGIISGSMSAAISRFITVELGKKNNDRLKIVFSTALAVQIVMGIIVVFAIGTIGIWFVQNKMSIPVGREEAAMWCLGCATISTFVHLMNIPFNSCIVAHEKMSTFAYMTLFDASMKLAICYAIYISPFDKLKTYSSLYLLTSILSTSIYWIYSLRKFEECTLQPKLDKGLFKEIWGFAGWNFLGHTSWILNTQGVNMLMNIFFGVVVNAARGIANQVNSILQQFVTNFMMALNPQITKSYAAGDKENAFKLACRGARFSFYIMWILSLPIMIEAHQVLKIWLGSPPEQADSFLVWTILSSLIMMMGNTLVTLQMAHGNIRHYQLWITIWACTPFPLIWIAYKLSAPAIYAYYIWVAVYWILLFVRWYLINEMTQISAKQYLLGVVAKCHIVAMVSAILPLSILCLMPETIMRLLIECCVCVCSSSIVIFFYGMDRGERTTLCNTIQKIIVTKILKRRK